MSEMELQEALESRMISAGVDRFNINNNRAILSGEASATAWYRKLTKEFVEPFSDAISVYLHHYQTNPNGRKANRAVAFRYIQLLDPMVAAYIATKVIFDNLTKDSTSIKVVCERIGARLEDQVRFDKLQRAASRYVAKVKTGLAHNHSGQYSHQKKVFSHVENKLSEIDEGVSKWIDWPIAHKVHIGARLADIFHQSVEFKGQPIIDKEVINIGRYGKKKSVARFKPSPAIIGWVDEFREVLQELSPYYSPCVVRPRDWVTPTNGGYHTPSVAKTVSMLKIQDQRRLRNYTKDKMPVVYEAINALQGTQWGINHEVLAIINEVVDRDLALCTPQREPYEIPPCPISEEYKDLRGMDLQRAVGSHIWQSFKEWKHESSRRYTLDKERVSKYLTMMRLLAQAKQYTQYEKFHFVYTGDFRCRLYANSSLLNPQGDDMQKGILRFSRGLEITSEGIFWLSVHGANLLKKHNGVALSEMSFKQRVAYMKKIEPEIRRIAQAPTLYRGWVDADKPWQFLAFCLEWENMLCHEESGFGRETFLSHLHVDMDGTCSGIQHYSALLRDPIGGSSVNLLPSDLPKDIYKVVAQMVEIKMRLAIINGTQKEKLMASLWLEVGISRDTTKKPVMTLPYGSTQMTCRDQIEAWLNSLQNKEDQRAKAEGREPKEMHGFNKIVPMGEAVQFCTKIVWSSISETLVAAVKCMSFITKVASEVAKDNKALEWPTPTGFVIRQEIFEKKNKSITTFLMGRTDLSINYETAKINKSKMKTASAPNFIHGLDASHLVFSVARMSSEDIEDIFTNHDMFGVHACNVVKMNPILRQEMVSMYTNNNNVLEDFLHVNEELCNRDFGVEVPESLGMDINSILLSEYIFS